MLEFRIAEAPDLLLERPCPRCHSSGAAEPDLANIWTNQLIQALDSGLPPAEAHAAVGPRPPDPEPCAACDGRGTILSVLGEAVVRVVKRYVTGEDEPETD